MSFTLLFWFALVGGILTFVSPCILPMVPIYLAYMSGSVVAGEKVSLRGVLLRIAAFVAGFTIVFTLFSVVFYVVFQSLSLVQQWIQRIAGLLVVGMGLHFLGVFRLSFLDQEMKLDVQADRSQPWGSFLLGVSFAAGWSPCIGPILSAILFSSATMQNLPLMIVLLVIFSLGIGIPFLITGIFVSSAVGWIRSAKRFFPAIEKISGIFLLLLGGLMILNTMGMISQWISEALPFLGSLETQIIK